MHGAHENTVQDQVLPPFVDLSPELVAGCFDHSYLVAVEIIYLSAGVGDLSAGVVDVSAGVAGCFDLSHLVAVGVVDLYAGCVHL